MRGGSIYIYMNILQLSGHSSWQRKFLSFQLLVSCQQSQRNANAFKCEWICSSDSWNTFLSLHISIWELASMNRYSYDFSSWYLWWSVKAKECCQRMLQCLHTFTFTMTGNSLQREVACPLCEYETDILIHWFLLGESTYFIGFMLPTFGKNM